MILFLAERIDGGYRVRVCWPALLVIVALWSVLGLVIHALDRVKL